MKQRHTLIYLCFFFSGAAGLIYEVVWSRQLSLFLGITSHAHTAVIAAYMLGLAGGSWAIGRRSDQLAQPLRFYAWLEIGIGLFAATTPWLFSILQTGYARWAGETGVAGSGAHLARFTIALVALLLPTFLMGGTLPLLVRGVMREMPQLGPVTGRLYGINTIGATFGTAVTGFLLLPLIGVTHSILVGVLINLGIAVVILLFVPRLSGMGAPTANKPTRGAATQAAIQEPSSALTSTQGLVLLAGFATAGFAALLTQLAWIRAMVLVVGGSVYAFTITLTSFLAGIGLGSLLYSQWLSHRQDARNRLRLAAVLAFLIGLTTLLSLSVIAQLPSWFLQGFKAGWVEEFAIYQVFIFTLCLVVMIVPTLLMGALFPLLAVSWTSTLHHAGRGIGSAYAVNTLGTIGGALLGGLVLLPWLGIHYSIILSAGLYCLVAVGFWLGGGGRRPIDVATAAVLFIFTVWLTPAWNRDQMANGAFYHPESKLNAMRDKSLQQVLSRNKLLYYREGLNGTVAVIDDEQQKSLIINGKIDASSIGDLPTQIGLGQIGALLHPNPRHALIIGLGSGITAGSLATQSSIEDITVLEISPEVVAASAFFSEENHHVLDDPRLNLVSADARNYVLATDRQWDLIISEPSNPWISGISNLFTTDFFRLIKQKLAPGGIMTQWFHTYGVSVDDVKTILKGFADTYRHVTVWQPQVGDLLMIGSDQPQVLDMQRLQDAFSDPLIGPEMKRAGFGAPRDLLMHYFFADFALLDYVTDARLNTDDRPLIEFNAPRSLYAQSTVPILQDMVQSINDEKFRLPLEGQYTQTDSALKSFTMNLEVASSPGGEFLDIQSDWWLWRLLQNGEAGVQLGVVDLRELTWNENGDQVKVQLLQDKFSPKADQRSTYMASKLSLPAASGGKLERANDPNAQWLLGAAPDEGPVDLALFWTCPLPDGNHNWFMVNYQLPAFSEQTPAEFAQSFANRFRCN